jgi:hypothetical protein
MKINNEFIQKIFNRKIEVKKKSDKIQLSQYSELIPMYDIYSDNIYPINATKLYYRLVDCHYRFITDEVKQWIENKMNKNDSNKEKYENMLKILDNYDLEYLEKTSYETLYRYSPDLGLSISICKRNSFHPYSNHLAPYYTKNELIKLGMNNMLIEKLDPSKLIDKQLHYDICKTVSKNDISNETISEHMKEIIKNKCINWIVFYSMTGSYIFNKILRSHRIMNKYMYDGLTKIIETINKVDLPKEYYFYRFVWDDKFLKTLKVGDVFTDNGFISTTRDPFYSPGIKLDFGLILLKINIPKHLKGVGLLIENFSLFPKEEEFLIQPFSKLKLKAKNEKAKYFHTNEKFEKLIKTKYEFDLIGTSDNKINIEDMDVIPNIELSTLDLNGRDRLELFNLFLHKCDNFGQFTINTDNKLDLFIAQWFDSSGSYSNMYKNKTKDGFIICQYIDGYPVLSIEMGEDMYVNYFRKICPYDNSTEKHFEININLIALFSKIFKYKDVKIHFNYKNFSQFENNYTDNVEYLYSKLYCDDIYQYFKSDKKDISKYFKYEYGYWKLDNIGKTQVSAEIINKLPKELNKMKLTWKELFILIVEKYFYLYKNLEEWMNNNFENIFNYSYYTFNTVPYLRKMGYDIVDIPSFKHTLSRERGDIFKIIFEENIRNL